MTRGIGVVELVSHLPDTAIGVAGLVTQLGDMWFVLFGITLVYAFSRWKTPLTEAPFRDSLYLFAIAIGAYAFTVVLKHAFALPRPPGATTATAPEYVPLIAHGVYESMVTGDGYGFPSGHALKTTAVYGGAALTLTTWDRTRQLLGAGVVATLVALSRVVLGVHYLVDVVVGVALGVVFLVSVERFTARDPQRALLVSFALGLLAVGLTMELKSGLVVVAAVGSLGLWRGRSVVAVGLHR